MMMNHQVFWYSGILVFWYSVETSERVTRGGAEFRNFSQLCFFCDEEGDVNLHACQTLEMSKQVRTMANDLADSKILAKLSEGDMVATEAKYHAKCILNLFNRHRELNRRTSKGSTETDFIEGKYQSEPFYCNIFSCMV